MKPQLFLTVSLALVIQACTSVEDVRNSAPVESAVVQGDYYDLAVCITQAQTNSIRSAQLIDDRSNRRATITARMEDGWSRPPLYELSLDQTENGVRVELRSPKTLVDDRTPAARGVWRELQNCTA